ncbi:MAG: aminoglycoside 6'-N-acetyltransferase [Novosphingobium sp.]
MIDIVEAREDLVDQWAALRLRLWEDGDVATYAEEAREMLGEGTGRLLNLIAIDGKRAVGFAEASLRRDYVNGCDHLPVVFLEGIYLAPEARSAGIGRRLCAQIEDWGRRAGCREFASDAWIDDHASHAFHQALGFAETERVVYFRKPLGTVALDMIS